MCSAFASWTAVLLFQPQHMPGHPENYSFSISKITFTRSKYPTDVTFKSEKISLLVSTAQCRLIRLSLCSVKTKKFGILSCNKSPLIIRLAPHGYYSHSGEIVYIYIHIHIPRKYIAVQWTQVNTYTSIFLEIVRLEKRMSCKIRNPGQRHSLRRPKTCMF